MIGGIKGYWATICLGGMALVYGLCIPWAGFAQGQKQGPVFSVIEENDLVVKTDRHYTQGLKFSYLQSDDELPSCVAKLSSHVPALGFSTNANKFGYEVGQNIYTPTDLTLTTLQMNDRPYAGWLYIGFVLQRRGEDSLKLGELENIQLDLGVIGPWSLAKEAQTWVHELRGFALPQGWGNQLKNEPGVDLKCERTWRLQLPEAGRHYMDFLPRAGVCLGNVETSARIGGTVRLGWNIPNDFGPQIVDSITTYEGGWEHNNTAGRWGLYGFAGAQAKAVGYSAFLDGNLFRSGPHVEREVYVGQWYGGFVFVMRRVDVGFTYVMRTKEFSAQLARDGFGSVFLKARL